MVKPYEPIYKISEVSKILKMNISSVYDLINSGQLPCLNLGSKKVKGVDLENFINNYPAENHVKEDKPCTTTP